MKNILITGPNSYIGKNIAKKLMHEKDNYYIEFISLKNKDWEKKSFAKFDVVIHLSALVHKKEKKHIYNDYLKVNYLLTKKVAEKSKEDGVHQFIFFSTMNVFGITRGAIDEKTKENPTSYYGKSKLKAEIELKKLQDRKFKLAIIRPPMVYGENCVGNFKTLFKFSKKISYFPFVNNSRSMIYIENLSNFVKMIIDNNETGIFHPQNNEYVNTSILLKKLSYYNSKEIKLIKGFEKTISILSNNINIFQKIFGDLTYEYHISRYKQNYCEFDLDESLKKITEMQGEINEKSSSNKLF